jgi:hypothetical protein
MIAERLPSLRYPSRREIAFAPPWDALPDPAACAALAAAGVATVVLDAPVDLRDPDALGALRFVRDAVACGIATRWTIAHGGGIDPSVLMHLSPPETFPGEEAKLALWREFAFGVLYWRRGSNFAIVRDVRPAWEPAYYTLESDGTLQSFERLALPRTLAEEPAEIVEAFREARFLIEIGDRALALPYRIRKWPVPFMAV